MFKDLGMGQLSRIFLSLPMRCSVTANNAGGLVLTIFLPVPGGTRILRLLLKQNAIAKGGSAAISEVGKKSTGSSAWRKEEVIKNQ